MRTRWKEVFKELHEDNILYFDGGLDYTGIYISQNVSNSIIKVFISL